MNVRIQHSLRFLAAVYYDGRIQMNEYTVKSYMMTNSVNPDDHNVALSRIKQFVYNELENTIFINSEYVDQCRKFVNAGLNITTMPVEPVDQIIGIMLYHKIKAITEDRLLIGEVEISSMLSDGIVYLHGENESVGELPIPEWWESCDLEHCDPDLIDTEKVVTIHKNSIWRDLNLHWPSNEDDTDDAETGNTVVFADFKRLDDTK